MDELTTKDVLGMVMNLSRDLGDKMERLGNELVATQTKLEKYNGLREKFDAMDEKVDGVDRRVAVIEQQAKGRSAVGRAIREWGGWVVGIAALAKSFIWG